MQAEQQHRDGVRYIGLCSLHSKRLHGTTAEQSVTIPLFKSAYSLKVAAAYSGKTFKFSVGVAKDLKTATETDPSSANTGFTLEGSSRRIP